MKRDRRKIMLRYKPDSPNQGIIAPALLPKPWPARIFLPAPGAKRAGWTLTAAITPSMPGAALAEIAGVGVFTDQVDQPCPAELVRQLPRTGLVQPHQRRVQFEPLVHPEIECDLQRLDGLVTAIRIAGIIGLAHTADDVPDPAPVGQRRSERQKHQIAAWHEG